MAHHREQQVKHSPEPAARAASERHAADPSTPILALHQEEKNKLRSTATAQLVRAAWASPFVLLLSVQTLEKEALAYMEAEEIKITDFVSSESCAGFVEHLQVRFILRTGRPPGRSPEKGKCKCGHRVAFTGTETEQWKFSLFHGGAKCDVWPDCADGPRSKRCRHESDDSPEL